MIKVAYDKKLHFIAGMFIALAVDFVCAAMGFSLNAVIPCGIIASMLCGAAKELVWDDCLGMGEPDIYDFLATMFGGLFASPFIYLALRGA